MFTPEILTCSLNTDVVNLASPVHKSLAGCISVDKFMGVSSHQCVTVAQPNLQHHSRVFSEIYTVNCNGICLETVQIYIYVYIYILRRLFIS